MLDCAFSSMLSLSSYWPSLLQFLTRVHVQRGLSNIGIDMLDSLSLWQTTLTRAIAALQKKLLCFLRVPHLGSLPSV
jgi:hypothetical protein